MRDATLVHGFTVILILPIFEESTTDASIDSRLAVLRVRLGVIPLWIYRTTDTYIYHGAPTDHPCCPLLEIRETFVHVADPDRLIDGRYLFPIDDT